MINAFDSLKSIGITSNNVSDIWRRKSDGRHYVYLANWKDKSILPKILNTLGRDTVVEFERVQSRAESQNPQDFEKVEKHLAGRHDQQKHGEEGAKGAKGSKRKPKNSWVMALPALTPTARKLRNDLAVKYGKKKVLLGYQQRAIIKQIGAANDVARSSHAAPKQSIAQGIFNVLSNNPELTMALARGAGSIASGAVKRTGQGIERVAYPYGKQEPKWEAAGRQQTAAEKLAKMATGYQPGSYYKSEYSDILKSLAENGL